MFLGVNSSLAGHHRSFRLGLAGILQNTIYILDLALLTSLNRSLISHFWGPSPKAVTQLQCMFERGMLCMLQDLELWSKWKR